MTIAKKPKAFGIEIDTGMPERDLLAEVLVRALRDVLHIEHDSKYWKRHAEGWFDSKSTVPWTFFWICEQLDLDPKDILKTLKKGERLNVR